MNKNGLEKVLVRMGCVIINLYIDHIIIWGSTKI